MKRLIFVGIDVIGGCLSLKSTLPALPPESRIDRLEGIAGEQVIEWVARVVLSNEIEE